MNQFDLLPKKCNYIVCLFDGTPTCLSVMFMTSSELLIVSTVENISLRHQNKKNQKMNKLLKYQFPLSSLVSDAVRYASEARHYICNYAFSRMTDNVCMSLINDID